MFPRIEDLQNSLGIDVILFGPELILCAAIVLMLFVRLFTRFDRWHLGTLALGLTLAALVLSILQWRNMTIGESIHFSAPEEWDIVNHEQLLFSGLLVYDT